MKFERHLKGAMNLNYGFGGIAMYSSNTVAILLLFTAVIVLLSSRRYYPKMKSYAELILVLLCMAAVIINMAAVEGYMEIISHMALGLLAIILLWVLKRVFRSRTENRMG